MNKVFFKPWIGKDYYSGGMFGKKILVLGEAHLCTGCVDCGRAENAEECADFTSDNCIEVLLSGETASWTGIFRKFERSLVNYYTELEESRKIFKNGYYRRADGKETRVLWVYHPSTGYSWDKWHNVIKTEL